MRKILFAILALVSFTAMAQDNTVEWKSEVKDNGDGVYTLVVKADIVDGWHIYDATHPFTPTTIQFTVPQGAALEGELRALSTVKPVQDEYFGSYGEYEGEAIFEQDVKLEGQGVVVKALVSYQACTEGNCTAPTEKELSFEIGSAAAQAPVTEVKAVKDAAGNGTMWAMILEAIIWGLAALVTPCVFPMIPMTVSFFMKGSGSPTKGRINAALYGFFIVLLYTLPIAAIIIITRLVGGGAVTADIFQWLATHWVPNILFFLVFMVFAASFFGAFDITLPSWLVNKSDENSEKGGIAGIFFMALTLVLVSFSCTGPIIGTLLVQAASMGTAVGPAIGMFGFALALSIPFSLFAIFPNMLQSMPKSGGWLNSVKVVLGFLELALALKFLSVADLAYGWRLLDREVFIVLWIAIFALLGCYLLGKIKFAHDSDLPYVSVPRLFMAIISFSFAIYMVPGLWGAPLKAISAFAPPLYTQDFNLYDSEVHATFDDYVPKNIVSKLLKGKSFLLASLMMVFAKWKRRCCIHTDNRTP